MEGNTLGKADALLLDIPEVRLVQLSDGFVASVLCGSVIEFPVVVIHRGVGGEVLTVEEAVVVLQCLRCVHQTSGEDRRVIDRTVVVDARCKLAGVKHRMHILAAGVEGSGRYWI